MKIKINSYRCRHCGRGFSKSSTLKVHLRTHTRMKPYQCKRCNQSFSDKWDLATHFRTHNWDEPYKCKQCGKGFSHKNKLIIHERRHTNENPHQCAVCNKVFPEKVYLKTHMRKHTGAKPYKCSYCGKAFTVNAVLKIHLRLHTGERPYQCQQCDKAFSQLGHVNIHMRKHTGEKPYKCSYCNKAFSQNSNLKIHLMLHTGERPFQCKICNKTFSQKINLISHWKIHHKDNPYHDEELKDLPNVSPNIHTKELPVLFNINPCVGNSTENEFVLYHNDKEFVKNVSLQNDPNQCIHCHFTFPRKDSLERHRKNLTCEKPNYCRHCHMLISKNIFRQHLETHSKDLLNLPYVSLKLGSKELPGLSYTDSVKGIFTTIDSITYLSIEDFTKHVVAYDNIYISLKPLEECMVCFKKFKLTQITILLTVPLRMKITCVNCKLVIYTIISIT